ncbi:hypothetical protein CHUAL_011283 [Chamberlinius hualienensis]
MSTDIVAVEVEQIYRVPAIQDENSSNDSTTTIQVDGIHPSETSNLPPLYYDIPGINHLVFNPEDLPTYDEVTDFNIPPPTYERLFGKVNQARKESNGILEFTSKLLNLIIGRHWRIILLLLMALPISGIFLGAMHLHDCPAEKYIPVFMLVAGSTGVVIHLLSLMPLCKVKEDEKWVIGCLRESKSLVVGMVLKCFFPAWFAVGSVWIYSAYEPNYENPESEFYCDKTLYLFSFWLMNSVFIVFTILYVVIFCCYGPKACFKSVCGK